MQLYFITMTALIIESLIFLSDYYGWKYIILLKTKNYILSNRKRLIISLFVSLILTVLNLLFPLSPGPVILGDLSVSIVLGMYVLYTVGLLVGGKGDDGHAQEQRKSSPLDILVMGHTTIEIHKRNLGFAILCIAFLHLIYPSGVLI